MKSKSELCVELEILHMLSIGQDIALLECDNTKVKPALHSRKAEVCNRIEAVEHLLGAGEWYLR